MASNGIRKRMADYLAEVEAHLQAAEPDERRETLRGIEEHLWEALRARGGSRRMADLESVLAQAAPPSSFGSARVRRTFPYRQVGWAAVAALGAAIALPGLALLASRLFGWNVRSPRSCSASARLCSWRPSCSASCPGASPRARPRSSARCSSRSRSPWWFP